MASLANPWDESLRRADQTRLSTRRPLFRWHRRTCDPRACRPPVEPRAFAHGQGCDFRILPFLSGATFVHGRKSTEAIMRISHNIA